MQSSIKIKRNKKYGDFLRPYEIILDGKNAGSIVQNQTISIAVDPGHHSLKMKIDWCGSEEINFNINPEEEIQFECENNRSSPLKALLIFYYLIFDTNNWILLKRYN
jgi:hypothetical protein